MDERFDVLVRELTILARDLRTLLRTLYELSRALHPLKAVRNSGTQVPTKGEDGDSDQLSLPDAGDPFGPDHHRS